MNKKEKKIQSIIQSGEKSERSLKVKLKKKNKA